MRISEVTCVIYLETCFHICPNNSLKAQKCGPENMSKCLVKTLFTLDIKYQIQLKICIQSSFRHGVRLLPGTENIEPSCLHVQHNFTFHVHGCNTQTSVAIHITAQSSEEMLPQKVKERPHTNLLWHGGSLCQKSDYVNAPQVRLLCS